MEQGTNVQVDGGEGKEENDLSANTVIQRVL